MTNPTTAPMVSVLIIARQEAECARILDDLSRQSFSDFEVIVEVGGTIPEAWNRAIARSQGRLLVFTETDARPLNKDWLKQLVSQIDDRTSVVKGSEIRPIAWNLSNTIIRRDALSNRAFDESFLVGEDTELFSYLRSQGHVMEKRDVAPVLHLSDPYSSKALRRAFRYGVNWMRIRHRYVDPVEPVPFDLLIRQLLIIALQTLGMMAGWTLVLKERTLRRRPRKAARS